MYETETVAWNGDCLGFVLSSELAAIKKMNQKLNAAEATVSSKEPEKRYNESRNKLAVSKNKERRDLGMKNRIGENIKHLRLEKKVTQEELAELFGVSNAAVSKWERGETYPDFELIVPLANYFQVSVDELMGYNASRMELEIQEVLEYRSKLLAEGKIKEAIDVMAEARKAYPSDFRIMHCYMWDVAGGYADNKTEVLLKHKDEFLGICRNIISGCTDDVIRRDAFNMQAKLLHAEGMTDEALEVYRDNFPNWYQTVGQKSEQLFAKDTEEFHGQLVCNMLELLAFGMDKKLKEIWHCMDLSVLERTKKSLALGEAISEMREKIADERLVFVAFKVYSNLLYKVAWLGEDDEMLAICLDRCLNAVKESDALCLRDALFEEFMTRVNDSGKAEKLLTKWLEFYRTTDIKAYVKMRESAECKAVLDKYK